MQGTGIAKSQNFLNRIGNSYYKPEIFAGVGLVLLSVILSFASPYFLTRNNLINLVRQISLYAIIASGMTFVILTGALTCQLVRLWRSQDICCWLYEVGDACLAFSAHRTGDRHLVWYLQWVSGL